MMAVPPFHAHFGSTRHGAGPFTMGNPLTTKVATTG
jgi:hypothetical protein